jgi:hypothetical protein
MFIKDGKRININAALVVGDGTQYPAGALRDPGVRYQLGISEIPEPFREDPDFFYVQEIDEAPFVINTPKPLEQIKSTLRAAVNAKRATYEVGGFVFEGKVFQSDQRSYERINAMATAALGSRALGRPMETIYWTAADNSAVAMTEQKVLEFFLAFTSHGKALFDTASSLKIAIERAESVAELRAIDLDSRWANVGTIPK